MLHIHPFLILVLAGYATFMGTLLAVSLWCWGLEAPRGRDSAADAPAPTNAQDASSARREAA